MPKTAAKVAISVTIHVGEEQGDTIKDATDFYSRLVDTITGKELFRFDYGNDLSEETAIVLGELYRYNDEWKFNSIGSEFNGGLTSLCNTFGLEEK